jgi:hypothetical protein
MSVQASPLSAVAVFLSAANFVGLVFLIAAHFKASKFHQNAVPAKHPFTKCVECDAVVARYNANGVCANCDTRK